MADSNPITLCYKKVGDLDILMDVWPPPPTKVQADLSVPAVVFFHGGGLTVGNRQSYFPTWLRRRFTALGYAFISADYRLIAPSTGYDILEDLKDLWAFVTDPALVFEFPVPSHNSDVMLEPREVVTRVRIKRNDLIVAGTSAGGMCAYLTAVHYQSPAPKGLLSIYGMGGDVLTPPYLLGKDGTAPSFRGREPLDPADPTLRPFLHPHHRKLKPIADSPLAYHPATYVIPGYPANPRMLLVRLYRQMGNFLDYYTGQHSPSLSAAMQQQQMDGVTVPDTTTTSVGVENLDPLLQKHLALFPQFHVSAKWPRTVLVHGTEDSLVRIDESRKMAHQLREHGVAVELLEVEGQEHSFDLVPDAEEKFSAYFDRVVAFFQSS